MNPRVRTLVCKFRPSAAKVRLAVVVCLSGLLGGPTAGTVSGQTFDIPSPDAPELDWWRNSISHRDERLGWWREARFGMFVHWGVYSTLGNEYRGRKGGGYAEHIQRILKIPVSEYRREVAGKFNPVRFNADEWIRTAKEAGMAYFIITAKHHDGFAMWPSKVNTYNISQATPFKRDPMAELRDACRKHGLRFGFYYSHAFDWGERDAPGNDWDYQNPGGDKLIGGRNWWETKPAFLPQARKYVDEKSIPQLLELIKNYDPDILWFDTPHKLPPSENLRILKAVRQASPRVVINGRLVRGMGDYASTADRPAEFAPHEGDWEGIPTTNESYGWNKFDKSHKPAAHFIQLLAKAAARGGNLLMNIGPMGDGEFDPKDLAILKGIGAWWRTNGSSIRGTTRTPLPVQTWGESTRKGNLLYLHVFNWPTNGELVVAGLKSSVKSVRLLASDRSLQFARVNPLDLRIAVPTTVPDPVDSVVLLECDGAIATDSQRLLQPEFGGETLRVFDAELHGKALKFGAGKTRDAHVTGWSSTNDFIVWPVRINRPGTQYDVSAVYDADAESAGGVFVALCTPRTKSGPVVASSTSIGNVRAGMFQTNSLGPMTFSLPGDYQIRVAARRINGSELLRLRALDLKFLRLILRRQAGDVSGLRSESRVPR